MRSIGFRALQAAQHTCPWGELAPAAVGPAATSSACASYSNSAATAAAAASWGDVLRSQLQGGFKGLQRRRYPAERLQPGTLSPQRQVPSHIPRPAYAVIGSAPGQLGLSKQPEGKAAMRAASQLAARALQLAGSLVQPGVTTDQLDAAVHDFLTANGAYPSPLSYHGFPKSICTSVNEVVCHGIPDSRPLREGDVVNIDVTAYLDGHHGDTNATFFVGQPSQAAVELVAVTQQALDAAIQLCGPDVPFRAIGHAIHSIADAAGMSVIREFVGHGIGKVFHAAPAVLHHRNWRPGSMALGQSFTIEPILTLGGRKHRTWADGWTVVTADGSLTAQFEHTLLVTQQGVEVLTVTPAGQGAGRPEAQQERRQHQGSAGAGR